MYPYCYQEAYSLSAIFLLHPWVSAVFLILVGIGLAVSWLKMRGWWRAIPIALALSLVGIVAFQPAKLQLKLSEAARLLRAGDWRKTKENFFLGETAARIEAYRVPLRSKCDVGFIVAKTEDGKSPVELFDESFPHSPAEATLLDFQDIALSRRKLCDNRTLLRNAIHSFEANRENCGVSLEFFNASHVGWPGFEMRWCRDLDEEHLYCEAEAARVAMAEGVQF